MKIFKKSHYAVFFLIFSNILLTNSLLESKPEFFNCIIQLDRWLPSREYTRIGVEEDDVTEEILSVQIPKVVVPVTGGRSN